MGRVDDEDGLIFFELIAGAIGEKKSKADSSHHFPGRFHALCRTLSLEKVVSGIQFEDGEEGNILKAVI